MTDKPKALATLKTARAQCLCGVVTLEIAVPARWAFHDHGRSTQVAHGTASATYVGSWRKRFRILKGQKNIAHYAEAESGVTRHFCARCGTPLYTEVKRAPHMVNIPRALFTTRTGREPLYHLRLSERPDWAYAGEALRPLKGFPGVMWTGPKKKKCTPSDDGFA